MAITHHPNDPSDVSAGGTWTDDFGRRICVWTWDPAAREIDVRCGPQGKRLKLPADLADLGPDALRQRLTTLALELSEQIKGTRYDL